MKVGYCIEVNRNPYDLIKEAAEKYGVDNAQLLVWDMSIYNEATANDIKRACREFDFEITALWCGWSGEVMWTFPEEFATVGLVPEKTRAQRIEDILKGAWFANEIGVKTLITHTGYISDDPADPVRVAVVDSFRHICREIKKYGQTFTFETGEYIPVTVVQFIKDIGEDNVGVNFDPANIITTGRGEACVALKLLAPYIKGFHAKDGYYPQGTEPMADIVRVVGTGDVDFPALIKLLREIGYDGPLSIEHEVESDNRDQDIKDSKAYLESIIASI